MLSLSKVYLTVVMHMVNPESSGSDLVVEIWYEPDGYILQAECYQQFGLVKDELIPKGLNELGYTLNHAVITCQSRK